MYLEERSTVKMSYLDETKMINKERKGESYQSKGLKGREKVHSKCVLY
jgi:hypothetical protein